MDSAGAVKSERARDARRRGAGLPGDLGDCYSSTVMKRHTQAAVLCRHRARERRWRAIVRAHPEAYPDNVWHTLVLLELPPLERLRRGLLRGQAVHPRRVDRRRG